MVWDNSGLCAVREWPALFCCRMCVLCLWGCVSFVAESMDTLARITFQMRKNGMYGNTMTDVLLSEGFSLWVVKPPSLNPWAQQSDSRKQHEICLHVCVFVLRPPLTLGSLTLTLFTHLTLTHYTQCHYCQCCFSLVFPSCWSHNIVCLINWWMWLLCIRVELQYYETIHASVQCFILHYYIILSITVGDAPPLQWHPCPPRRSS